MIKKVLIANRGEIALRILRTLKSMKIESVTIYTEEEKTYPHAYSGDVNINLGSGSLKETYLNQDLILKIAKDQGVDAIHPGYGFLSEKADFALKVKNEGLIFIGPSVEAISLMGDKKASKEKIVEIGIPSIPGYHGNNQDPAFLYERACDIGLPILIKASAGGGGKGMRIVESFEDFYSALDGAKREALNAFSDDNVLIEKYIKSPRHIEVQVMSDTHGQHFHLFERECSIQRRYQKIVEETPSVALDTSLRMKMTSAAVTIAKAIQYIGAGTVEFILDTDGQFYFLEMNTRLQVEHPITEMVTGLDLVSLQIKVANNEKLDLIQERIIQKGHALEVRLYAEDPDNDFLPSIGKILKVGKTNLSGVRLESGLTDGNDVSIAFDPMLAKLVVHAETRELAISKMIMLLGDYVFLGEGVKTNRDYLKRILMLPEFVAGKTYTHFVKTYADKLQPQLKSADDKAKLIAAYFLSQEYKLTPNGNPWESLKNFRNA